MLRIKTLADLKRLPTEKPFNSLTPGLGCYLKSFFLELYEAFSEDSGLEEFSLEPHGYFILMEKEEGFKLFCGEGTDCQAYNLLGSRVEYIERLSFEDGSQWLKLAVLEDNDFMVFYFLPTQNLSEEEQALLFVFEM